MYPKGIVTLAACDAMVVKFFSQTTKLLLHIDISLQHTA